MLCRTCQVWGRVSTLRNAGMIVDGWGDRFLASSLRLVNRHDRLVGAPEDVGIAHLGEQSCAGKHLAHRRLQAAEADYTAALTLFLDDLCERLRSHRVDQRDAAH